jgi:hypothetical protein
VLYPGVFTRNQTAPIWGVLPRNQTEPIWGVLIRNQTEPILCVLRRNQTEPILGVFTWNQIELILGVLTRNQTEPIWGVFTRNQTEANRTKRKLTEATGWMNTPLVFYCLLVLDCSKATTLLVSTTVVTQSNHLLANHQSFSLWI